MEKKKKSMKLRTRVIISFFIIILVPIVMCALTFYFFVGYKAKIIGEKYGLANATYRTISNNTLLLNAMTSEEYDEVEDTAKSDTAKLEETNYLSVLNARLQKKQSFIAVREDGVIIYNGSEELSSEELENELPKYGDPGANSKGGVYFRNEKQWMVKQVDYENSDGKECSAFIVTKTDQIAPQITGMVKELGMTNVVASHLEGTTKDKTVPYSLETLTADNPDIIFVVTMGKEEEITKAMKKAMTDNPAWANLKAVQNNRVIYLPSKLFLLNPGLQTPEAMARLVKEAYGINVTF